MSCRRQGRTGQPLEGDPTAAESIGERNRRLAMRSWVVRHEARAAAGGRGGGRHVWVFETDGVEVLDPPLTMNLSGDQLVEKLVSMRHAGRDLWPDATPLFGALSLLLVQLEEAIDTRPPTATRLELHRSGVRAV